MNNITRLANKKNRPLIHGSFHSEHFIAGIAPENMTQYTRMIIVWEWRTTQGYYMATWNAREAYYSVTCDGNYINITTIDHMMLETRETALRAEILSRAREFPEFAAFLRS